MSPLVVVFAEISQGSAHGVAVDLGVALELRLFAELGFGQAAVAGQLDVADPDRVPRRDLKVDIDQRVFAVDDPGGRYLATVVSIVLERRLDGGLCLCCPGVGEGGTRLQLGSAIKRSVEAIVFHPFHVNPADEEAWNAGKYDGDTVARPHAGHFNGLVKAGGVQAA